MKYCTKCKKSKELIEFSKDVSRKDGLSSQCKSCRKTYAVGYYVENREGIIKKAREYNLKNKEEISIKNAIFYEKNKEENKQKAKIFRERNKKKNTKNKELGIQIKVDPKKCYECKSIKSFNEFYHDMSRLDGFSNLCKSCSNSYVSEWQKSNPEKCNKRSSLFRKKHPDRHSATQSLRKAKKLQRTPPWLTKEQLKEMEDIYSLAKELQWLSEEPLEVDHEVPLQGKNVSGLHVPWNLQILPESMNRSKSNKF